MKLQTEEDFKEIPRLRWKLDEDGTPIAVTIQKKLKRDHLYFHGPEKLGIYYERKTIREATAALAWWKKRITGDFLQEFPGDFDGIITFYPRAIPKEFLRSAPKGIAKKNALQAGFQAQEGSSDRPDGVQIPSEPPEAEKSSETPLDIRGDPIFPWNRLAGEK